MTALTKCLLAFFFLISLAISAFSQQSTMTNDEVVSLSKAGLSADIIVAKIKSGPAKFDTSSDKLKELKDAGIADAVILAMVQYPLGSASVLSDSDTEIIPGETKAIVYVYRRKEYASRNLQPSVYVDDAEVARMDDGKFFIVKLEPGKHNVVVNKGFSGAIIDMKPGRKYYFRVSYKTGFLKARSEMEYVAREQGQLEVGNMQPLEDKWIKDRKLVTVKQP